MRNQRDRRSGVAVVIVLGMLALLMVLGVAFSTTMRVERFGAGNYARDVRSKQTVLAALAHAIGDLDDDLVASGSVFPEWDVIVSRGIGGNCHLVYGEALDYVPGVLRSYVANTNATWMQLADSWIAYHVINCSDMLDVNYVGEIDHTAGTNSTEVQVSGFGQSIIDLADFRADRVADVRYESLPELLALNSGITNDPHDAVFVTYSRFPADDAMTSLTGDKAELLGRKGEIKAVFAATVDDCRDGGEFLFNSLIDYIDTDSIPYGGALDKPYVERVPMIYEVWVEEMTVDRTLDTCSISKPHFVVEVAFPFADAADENFNLEVDVWTTVTDIDNGVQVQPPTKASGTLGAAAAMTYDAIDFRRRELPDFDYDVAVTSVVKLAVDVELKCRVVNGDGTAVDAAPFPDSEPGFSFSFTVEDGIQNDTRLSHYQSYECADPRFNWEVSAGRSVRRDLWVMHTGGTNTEGRINVATTDLFTQNPRSLGYDTNMQMRVSNHGRLFSVGELGYLLRREHDQLGRFNTIRLFDVGSKPRDRVLERFTLQEVAAQGLVNLNSVDDRIVLSAFRDTPLRRPDETEDVSISAVSNLVTEIVDNGPYTNLTEICDLDWSAIGGLDAYTEIERESILAHCWGLIGIRQNLFLIVVAEGIDTGGVGSRLGSNMMAGRRAVALVWRDPFPDEDGMHPCFVRYFKYLDN